MWVYVFHPMYSPHFCLPFQFTAGTTVDLWWKEPKCQPQKSLILQQPKLAATSPTFPPGITAANFSPSFTLIPRNLQVLQKTSCSRVSFSFEFPWGFYGLVLEFFFLLVVFEGLSESNFKILLGFLSSAQINFDCPFAACRIWAGSKWAVYRSRWSKQLVLPQMVAWQR